MQIPFRVEQEGFFTAEISGGKRGTIVFAETPNLILDSGFARLMTSGANVLQYISVGTGSSPPHTSQTGLDSRVATTSRNSSETHSYVPAGPLNALAYGQTTFSVQFDRGVAAGNLTEVAVGWTSDGSENWSRSLFKDSMGMPTAITVKSDEFFRVTYILKRYVPIPWTGIINYNDDGVPAQTQVTVSPGTNNSTMGNGSGGNQRLVYISAPGSGPVASFVSSPRVNQAIWEIFFDLDYGVPAISQIVTSYTPGIVRPHLIPQGTTISFDPPVPKSAVHDLTIEMLLTVARHVS